MVGREDLDGVELGIREHLLEVGVDVPDAPLLGSTPCYGLVDVAHRVNLGPRVFEIAEALEVRDPAAAHEAHAQHGGASLPRPASVELFSGPAGPSAPTAHRALYPVRNWR